MSDEPSEVKAQSFGVDGGLNLKGDPQRLAPPAVTRADNVWHLQSGNVQQLPAFNSYSLDAVPPTSYLHTYNLGVRDTAPPTPGGDVMLHAEVADTLVPGLTRSLWLSNLGRTPLLTNSSLPFTLRMRLTANSLGTSVDVNSGSSSLPALYRNGFTFIREEGTTSRRRCLLGRLSNGSFTVYPAFVDGFSKFTTPTTIGNLSWTQADGIGVLSDGTFAVVGTTGSQTAIFRGDFNSPTLFATGTNISTAQNAQVPPFQLFHHAGRTYFGFSGPSTTFVPSIRDVASGATATLPSQGTALPAAVAFASPYPLQTPADTTYFAMVFNRSLYVVARSVGGVFTIVGGPSALPNPAVVPAGTVNYAATVVASVGDSQGGIGVNARINITVFQHYPERVNGSTVGSSVNIAYQGIVARTWYFQAAFSAPATTAGTLASTANDYVFRTPAGAGLVSKAFLTSPGESGNAGPIAARQPLVVVQSGATEPEYNALYNPSFFEGWRWGRDSQPTYFLINHQCEVVGRFGEGIATPRPTLFVGTGSYQAAGNDTTNIAAFPNVPCFANPLFSDSSTSDDQAVLNISLPVWALTDIRPVTITTEVDKVVYENRGFSRYNALPMVATLSLSQGASGVPAISAGPHTFIGGPVAQVHDGQTLCEQNYHFGAHNMIVSTSVGTGYPDNTKRYTNVYLVYSWFDSEGRKHRSQPSLASTVSVNAGEALQGVNCYVPCPVSTKDKEGGPITAEIYASLENNTDTIAYFCGAGTVASVTTATTGYVPYVFVGANCQSALQANLRKQAPMYVYPSRTSSGYTFASTPPRSFYYQVAGKGRCFALAQVSGQQRLYYSSVASDVNPYEWNTLNYAPIPPDIGDARSLEIIDDKVVVLGTRGNAVMSGDGPAGSNTSGAPAPNDGFSPVTPVPTPAGVIGTGSPARIPEGIVFQGYSGIQLLGRDLSVAPLGAEVDALSGRQVGVRGTVYGRAVTLPALQSVVWPNPRGAALVYSYLTKKWSTWPLLPGASLLAQRMDGSVWAALAPLSGNQLLAYGTSGPGADMGFFSATTYLPTMPASTAAGLVVETPWINIGGVTGGEADLWDMELVGTWQGPHTLQVEQAYNYGSYVLTQSVDMSTAPTSYQTRWRPLDNSRMWAVRYRVSLLPLTNLQAGYAMAGLSDLVVYSAPMDGTTRTPESRTR